MAKKSNTSGASGPARSGGGANMNKNVKVTPVVGKPAKGVNAGAVSYLGNKMGNHTTDNGDFVYKPTPWNGKPPVNAAAPLGNAKALDVGRGFKPMSPAEQTALRETVQAEAGDGRHELFKSSKQFDGPHHRKQHGFAATG